MTRSNRKYAKWIIPITTLGAFFCDAACKEFIRATLSPGEPSPFIPGLVRLYLTTNTGAAFSLGAGNGYLMTSLATVVTLFLVAWMLRREAELVSNIERAGLGLLFGGACGNLFDRFTQGRVTDFLDLTFIDFPIFNTADMFIDVGIALILLSMLLERRKGSAAAQANQGLRSRLEACAPENMPAENMHAENVQAEVNLSGNE
jgi:signal peptidase II